MYCSLPLIDIYIVSRQKLVVILDIIASRRLQPAKMLPVNSHHEGLPLAFSAKGSLAEPSTLHSRALFRPSNQA